MMSLLGHNGRLRAALHVVLLVAFAIAAFDATCACALAEVAKETRSCCAPKAPETKAPCCCLSAAGDARTAMIEKAAPQLPLPAIGEAPPVCAPLHGVRLQCGFATVIAPRPPSLLSAPLRI